MKHLNICQLFKSQGLSKGVRKLPKTLFDEKEEIEIAQGENSAADEADEAINEQNTQKSHS